MRKKVIIALEDISRKKKRSGPLNKVNNDSGIFPSGMV
jgi:hypothetical protein